MERRAAFAGLAAAGPLCLYFATCGRYQIEFVPVLGLLAAVGFLALYAHLDLLGAGRAWGAGLLVAAAALSIAFNGLTVLSHRSDADTQHGLIVLQSGRFDEAARWFARAARLRPTNVLVRVGLANSRQQLVKLAEAVDDFQKAEAIDPASPSLHFNFAYCLFRLGRRPEAIAECEWALRFQPDFPAARAALAALRRDGP